MIIMVIIVIGDIEIFFLVYDISNYGYYYYWRYRYLVDLWLLSYYVNGEINLFE